MADIDMRKLTTEAEQGHGDVLQQTLQTVSFDAGLRILMQMEKQNQQDLQDNSTQTQLFVKPHIEKETKDMPPRASVEVVCKGEQLFYEELDMKTGEVLFSSSTTKDRARLNQNH